jgi:amidase
VALAAGTTTLADGSDIGGSIRIPAACCGVVGYKPPTGRNPNPLESTFDPYLVYGPMGRTVEDVRMMQNLLSGVSPEDIGTLRESHQVPDDPEPVAGWSVAYSVDLGYFQVDDEVRADLLQTVDLLRSLGCTVTEVDLGWTEETYDAWVTVNASRGSAARKVGDVERWWPHLSDYVQDMLERGSRVGSAALVRALDVHTDMYRRLAPVLETHRVLLCPTNAVPSVPAERSPLDLDWTINGRPARRRIAEAWFMTYPFNMLSQLPVLNVPTGTASTGVPLGVQIVGPSYDDDACFALGAALERAVERPAWPR